MCRRGVARGPFGSLALKKTRSGTEKMGTDRRPSCSEPEQAEKHSALVSMQGTRKRFGIRFGPCIVEHKVLWCKTPQRVKLKALRLEAVCF